ncbi:hypothetical protein [Candidimonas nitroreducens]|uniref:hypothetical protein n=1 Tax=Candidimonas nitroreducens TaxID=683354 RepID=UPI0011777831|nr:hypothetical protein [Candidimonas nitroreducens]
MLRRYAAVAAMLAALAVLAACSPRYNWREAPVAAGAVVAAFPDKPETHRRVLPYEDGKVEFFLTTARVDDTVFAVGYAPWPDALRDDAAAQAAFGRAVLSSLYRNLDVAPPAQLPEFGQRFAISGRSPKGAARMEARLWLLPDGLVEGLVTAAASSYPQHEADEFFRALARR